MKRRILTTKERDAALKRMQKIVDWLAEVNNDIVAFAEKFKFERISTFNQSSVHVYKHSRLRVVVKAPYISFRAGADGAPAYAIPTIVLDNINTGEGCYNKIFIQPLGSTRRKYEAVKILQKRKDHNNYDDHEGNVAWYKGCPVWIDW